MHLSIQMKLILIILSLSVVCSDFGLNLCLKSVLKITQSFCLNYTPASKYDIFYSAIVCGVDHFTVSQEIQSLKTSGLYHLLVVSGSHLIFLSELLEWIFKRIGLNIFLKYFLMVLFAVMTGLQPPVLRSIFSLTLHDINKSKNCFWTSSEIALASLLICLLLNSSWDKSYGLILSHAAGLALIMFNKHSPTYRHLGIYATTFLFLLPLQLPNPISVFSNLCLSSIIGYLLFPVSFFCYFVPFLTRLADPLWEFTLRLLNWLSEGAFQSSAYPIPIALLWALLITTNLILIWRKV